MMFRRTKKSRKTESYSFIDMKLVAKAQAAIYLKVLKNVEDSTGVDLFLDNMEEQNTNNVFLQELRNSKKEKDSYRFVQISRKYSSFNFKERETLNFANPRLATA